VTVRRDEEHNRYLLHIEDRSNGFPRQHAIGVEFVTAAEYRTLLANRRDIPAFDGEVIVTAAAGTPEETEPADGGVRPGAGEGQAAPAQGAPAQAAPAGRPARKAPEEVTLRSLDELVDYFIAAGKKGVAINRYKGLGEMNPEQLWETTMDPGGRTLLQVRAED